MVNSSASKSLMSLSHSALERLACAPALISNLYPRTIAILDPLGRSFLQVFVERLPEVFGLSEESRRSRQRFGPSCQPISPDLGRSLWCPWRASLGRSASADDLADNFLWWSAAVLNCSTIIKRAQIKTLFGVKDNQFPHAESQGLRRGSDGAGRRGGAPPGSWRPS